jgi:RHS repeat-associated protein
VNNSAYDALGRVSSVSDADGRVTVFAYDATGNLVSQDQGGSVQLWGWDLAGHQVSYADPAGAVTEYTYDAAGNMASRTDASGTTVYGRDPAGNLTSQTAPDGTVTTSTYDGAGRVTGVAFAEETPDVAFTYDLAGRRASMTDGTGTTAYTYNPSGEISGVSGPGGRVGYTWDQRGQLARLAYPDQSQVEYSYDQTGQLTKVVDWDGGEFQQSWNEDGEVESLSYPNGVTTEYGFDAAGRTSGMVTKSAGGATVLDLAYTYTPGDLVGSLTAGWGDGQSGAASASAYSWDPQARLAEVSYTGAGSFGFDQAGRAAELADGTELAYDEFGRLASSVFDGAETSYSYDARGNRVGTSLEGAGQAEYGFDTADRLVSATTPDGDLYEYAYNGDGLRASTTKTPASGAAGQAAWSVWDASGDVPLLLAEGSLDFLYGLGSSPLAQRDRGADETVYLHGDLVGSIRSVTDSAGGLAGASDYTPYGRELPAADPLGLVSEVSVFGFAGERLDPTGLVYLRARFYDPATAQFLAVDVLVDMTRSAYGYTGGNPLQFTDPLGEAWWNPKDWNTGMLDTVANVLGGASAVMALIPVLAPLAVAVGAAGALASGAAALGHAAQGHSATDIGLSVLGAVPFVGGQAAKQVAKHMVRQAAKRSLENGAKHVLRASIRRGTERVHRLIDIRAGWGTAATIWASNARSVWCNRLVPGW